MSAWRITVCTISFALAVGTAATAADREKANSKTTGKSVYMARCEACHMMGMNVIKPGKDIVVSTKLVSLDEFKEFLSEPHGVMPAFKELANDSEIVKALYGYTKKLKHQNWTYYPPLDNQPAEPVQPKEKQKPGTNQKPAG